MESLNAPVDPTITRMNEPARIARPGLRGRLRSGLLLVACALAFGLMTAPARAQSAATREYQIKAVFLFNFLQFVEWPATAFPGPDTPLLIGVLGDDPFGPALEEAVRGETVHNRRLLVRRSQRLDDLQDCQLLFISKSENRRVGEILSQLNGRPVLTVSELDGFARRGGVIAFYPDGKKVRFEINPASARLRGLKMSSELLGLGRIVGDEVAGGGT
jgi:hypothetical protein